MGEWFEEWKPVVGYEGLYKISNLGNVVKNNGVMVSKIETDKGYLSVNLRKNFSSKLHKIHRLVSYAFIPNPHNKPQVDHIDGNKQNNHVDNLRWCTQRENIEFHINDGAGYKGIYQTKHGRYLVRVWVGDKKKNVATFKTKLQAEDCFQYFEKEGLDKAILRYKRIRIMENKTKSYTILIDRKTFFTVKEKETLKSAIDCIVDEGIEIANKKYNPKLREKIKKEKRIFEKVRVNKISESKWRVWYLKRHIAYFYSEEEAIACKLFIDSNSLSEADSIKKYGKNKRKTKNE